MLALFCVCDDFKLSETIENFFSKTFFWRFLKKENQNFVSKSAIRAEILKLARSL